MSSKPDGGLRAEIRSRVKGPQWVSIETGLTEQGVPDMNCAYRGHETWIECKRTKASAIKFQPNQLGWIMTRIRQGGRCLVAVRHLRKTSARLLPADSLYVYDGRVVIQLQQSGLAVQDGLLMLSHGGPGAWDWERFIFLISQDSELWGSL